MSVLAWTLGAADAVGRQHRQRGAGRLNGKVWWAMRAETQRPRQVRLGRAKVLAVSVPVLASFFVWWSVLAVLPLWAATLVLALVVASIGVALVPSAEPAVVRLCSGPGVGRARTTRCSPR